MGLDLLVSDWSGVVSNDFDTVYGSWENIFTTFGKRMLTPQQCRENYRANIYEFYAEHGIHDKGAIDRLHREWLAKHKPVPIPGASEAFKMLAQLVPVVIFSSHPQYAVEEEAKAYGLEGVAGEIFGGVNKKSPEDFERVLRKTGARRNKTLYIGDTNADTSLAKLVGVKSFAIISKYGYQTRELVHQSCPPTEGYLEHVRELIPKLDLF